MNQSSELKKVGKFPKILNFCKSEDPQTNAILNPGTHINRYRDFMNTLPLSAFEADIKGNITYANPKAYELFGHHTSTRHDGNSCFDFISSNDRDRARENFIRTVNNKHIAGNYYTAIKKNGDSLPIIVYSNPFYSFEKVAGIRGVILDATLQKEVLNFWKDSELNEHKVNEERLKSIYDNASVGMFRISNLMRFEMMNPAFVKMLGYEDESELLKNEWIVNGFFAGIQQGKKASKNNSENEFEISLPRRNGEVAALKVTIKCYHNERGSLLYCDGMVEDVSKKKETEQALVEAMKKAEAAEKLKSEFLAQMSHEIRTPINTILSFTGLLKEEMYDKIPDDLRISFDLINRAGKRIIRTIDLILLMSELQTRTYESDPKVFDIYTDVIENIYPHYLSLAREKGLAFNISNNCRNTKIKADFPGVQQMISNLFDNAIKYTERGSVTVEILPGHNSHVTVAVKDTGIGIAEEYLQTMFKPFSQEESGYTRKYEGNGLGLAVVNKFAELNDASIEVESQKGEGTLIKVNFGLS